MTTTDAHAVGLRDLRHHTSEVLARVRHGETIDVTEHGRLIARIVPVGGREPAPTPARLVASRRASPARRPGYRLRSLDAPPVHAARSLGQDHDAVVSYDDRLTRAASDAGLTTVSPND